MKIPKDLRSDIAKLSIDKFPVVAEKYDIENETHWS